MSLAIGNPTANVELFIGYDPVHDKFFFSNANGSGPAAVVDLLRGQRGDAISWRIFNKTGMDKIFVTLDDFETDSMGRCPVALFACEARVEIMKGEFADILSAVVQDIDFDRRYLYEVAISAVDNERGDSLDPELQIDA